MSPPCRVTTWWHGGFTPKLGSACSAQGIEGIATLVLCASSLGAAAQRMGVVIALSCRHPIVVILWRWCGEPGLWSYVSAASLEVSNIELQKIDLNADVLTGSVQGRTWEGFPSLTMDIVVQVFLCLGPYSRQPHRDNRGNNDHKHKNAATTRTSASPSQDPDLTAMQTVEGAGYDQPTHKWQPHGVIPTTTLAKTPKTTPITATITT
ncbi:hypothetical protein EI94DRAFT_1710415 [Lactarius quietus]|nr:hypothetical protein EI94DRAFT_1710415 [Lactarius quietus]